jgi:autotransporter-associated beta strand protein
MRAHLLATAATTALLVAASAQAQDATWSTTPGSGDFNTAGNWTPATVPTGTAFFGPSTITSLSWAAGATNTLGGFTFNAGAPAYSFSLAPASRLTFTGAGIVNNSSNAPSFFVTSNSLLAFTNGSTAGNAIITNSGTSAVTQFSNSSSAANATITNTGSGFTSFNDASTASNATITSSGGGFASFLGSSTAANATLTANFLGFTTFSNSSSAGNATINTNFGGSTSFSNSSTAGNATLTTNNGGTTLFTDSSTAGRATLVTNLGGTTQFTNFSTAGNATVLTNQGGTTLFSQFSTGGNAGFTTQAGGVFDMSGLIAGGMTAGSIEGAGNYFLGSKTLTVLGDNLFAEVSGAIQDGGASGGRGGSLVKEGIGVLLLSGNNTYTGTTTVNAGALIVNGSIASSSLTTVKGGAALIGSGTVGSTVVNRGGFLVPGTVLMPGSMAVVGDLTVDRGAFYVVQVNPQTASRINVSGTASLDGTAAAIFAPGIYLARSYTILTADNRRTGRFDDFETFGLPRNFRARLDYFNNSVELNLRAQLIPDRPGQLPFTPTTPGQPFPPIPGFPPVSGTSDDSSAAPPTTFTSNELNSGRAIDNFFNNGGALPPAFVSLFNLTGGNLTNALDQLSGEAATGAQKVGFQLTDQFLNVMLDPFVDGRSGVSGADHPALGFAPERETMPPQIALAYASVLKEPRAPLPPVYEPRWTAWGGAYGGSNRTTGDLAVVGSHDLSARTVGFAGGFDYRLSPDTVVGLAFAGGGTDWSLSQGLGGGKSDAFQVGLYGATKYGPAYLAAAFAFANHWMSTDRLAVGDHLTADFNAQSYGGRLEGGYRFGTTYGGIAPYAAIQAQSFHTPSYTETGLIPNGFALAFGARDATDTRSELGARFDRIVALYPNNAVLALRGRLAWAHDWVSDPTLTPLFQALPGASFIVNGAVPAHNSALTSAGAELRLANGIALLAKFDGEFASHSSTYGGTGTLRYRW